MDDQRIGRILRALRRRAGLRQADLARLIGCHQTTISRAERGHLEHLSVALMRRMFAALDARFEGQVTWRGGALDRLLDERHAGLVEQVAELIPPWGWQPLAEVTFSDFGERGSIDLFAAHRATHIVTVFEMKSELTSIEETVRRHDVKVRLAAKIAIDRFGWRPVAVARILVLPESTTAREAIARHSATLSSVYPKRGQEVRSWLRRPQGRMDGVWLLRPKPGRVGKRSGGGPSRVRTSRPRVV